MSPQDKQIQALRKLGLTEEEINEVLIDDKRIDKGEKLFELSDEQKKASKAARQADRKVTVYKLDNTEGKRSKKANSEKQEIISLITNSLNAYVDKPIEVVNIERELVFYFKNVKYKLVLSVPRK